MARQDDTVMIDNNKYLFTQLDPRRAARVYLFLTNKIGSTLGKAIGSLKGGKILDADIDMKSLGEAVEGLFSTLDDDSTLQHIETLLSSVLFNGQQMNLDSLNFQGKMLHLTKVTKKAVEVNFSDFLDENNGLVAKLKGMFNTIQDRQTSTGSSGDQSLPALPRSRRSTATGA